MRSREGNKVIPGVMGFGKLLCLLSAGNTGWEFQGKSREIDTPILWRSAGFLGETALICLLPWPLMKATYF